MGHFSPGTSPAIRIAEKHTAVEGKPAALRHLSNFLPWSERGGPGPGEGATVRLGSGS